MARQTRAQRRARRAETARAETVRAETARDATKVERPRATQAGAPRAAVGLPAREAAERRLPGGGFRRFVFESWGELKKVEWPTQNQLIQGVAVVLIACLIVGIWLYASDLVFKRLVQDVFL